MTETRHGVIEAPVQVDGIRKTYGRMSKIYFLSGPLETRMRMRGIDLAAIQPHDKVLEVAVGIGQSFVEILKRVDRGNTVCGVDLTLEMLEKTRRRALKGGYRNFELKEADARHLPFPDGAFDVLYNSYMLDLIPLADFPRILGEFRRVLRDGGRLVLVNLSKKDASPVFYEKLYRLAPYLLGGCRPVLMAPFVREAAFRDVMRESPRNLMVTEIVTAVK